MLTAQARRNLRSDALMIAAGVIVAAALSWSGWIDSVLAAALPIQVAAFISGMFFTSAFTIAPASIALARLSVFAPLSVVALWGALGAMVGDLVIFFFLRDRFAADVMGSLRPSVMRHVLASFHLGFLKWLSPVMGAAIIASPLPDEFGLALMGLSRTRAAVLMPISFAMNWIGIYLVSWFAHSI